MVLRVQSLEKRYYSKGLLAGSNSSVYALRGVSLEVAKGETLGVVGESGCGKSTLGKTVLRLQDSTAGRVFLKGCDITELSYRELRPYRRRMQMIFQNPLSSFNPRMTIFQSLREPLQVHSIGTRAEQREMIERMVERVGLSPESLSRYPHQFSGGQCQRLAIARALLLSPDLIVADEAVSALDVSIQAQILTLLQDLQSEFGIALLFITHDLSVVRYLSDRIAVMYAGRVVEEGPSEIVMSSPKHPYTELLLSSIPGNRGSSCSGEVGLGAFEESGCPFSSRCAYKKERCLMEAPVEIVEGNRRYSCWHPLDSAF